MLASLMTVGHSDSSGYPVIQIATKLIAVGHSKVIDPVTYKLTGLKKLVMHTDTHDKIILIGFDQAQQDISIGRNFHVQQGFTLLIDDTCIQSTSLLIDSRIVSIRAIVKGNCVFSFLI